MHEDEWNRKTATASDFTLREQYAIRMFARMKRERACAAIRDAAQENGR